MYASAPASIQSSQRMIRLERRLHISMLSPCYARQESKLILSISLDALDTIEVEADGMYSLRQCMVSSKDL